MKIEQKPVTFDGFASVVSEFQREYECKLSEIQEWAISIVKGNEDIDLPATFCCTSDGCTQKTPETAPYCGPDEYPNQPLCDPACAWTQQNSAEFEHRLTGLVERMTKERMHSRAAVERSLLALRSFELNYTIARQLLCYERASFDLRNELSLLSDAVSCMPRIWDTVTSLHDRKKASP